ncbi:MAG: hypothetical protein ABL858_04705 [Candidatus Nitrotoga sp.]
MIDADVARASGGSNATHSDAIATRDFLQFTLTICHKVVMTSAMQAEWNTHQSEFARKWRRSMVNKRKLVVLTSVERHDIRNQIESLSVSDNNKEAMFKDCHLIEAALASDNRVISMDDTVKNLFSAATSSIPDLRNVLWVNPAKNYEKIINWLRDGAPIEGKLYKKWRLGHHE